MVGMKLYVEGGGDTNLLRTACRQGFSEFLKKAGLAGRMPRVVACGGRQDAYDAFCTRTCRFDPGSGHHGKLNKSSNLREGLRPWGQAFIY